MNICTSGNSYYIDKSSGSMINIVTNRIPSNFITHKDVDLIPEITPKQALNMSKNFVPKKQVPVIEVEETKEHRKTIYEVDGVEINPVDILFQPLPPSKEEKIKEFMQHKKRETVLKFKKFKEFNERLMENNEANPVEWDLNFKKTIRGMKTASKEVNQREIEPKPSSKSHKTNNNKNNGNSAKKSYGGLQVNKRGAKRSAGLRNLSSGFNPFPSEAPTIRPSMRDTSFQSINSWKADAEEEDSEPPVEEEAYKKPKNNFHEPPIAAASPIHSISKAIWNTINYYWAQSAGKRCNTKEQNADNEKNKNEVVVRKSYQRLGNGQIVFVSEEEGTREKFKMISNESHQPSSRENENGRSVASVFWNIVCKKFGF
ncbi:hypothetical protein DASC09_041660 [Saccharomycopsis crataegensis]|uniref:Uncharacterized protein n=1 Tax=Saccharomycopsis crataegensis TaxID=43959 RepID=A0AAV5QQJ4_9ASCO|nr:hypothetical protein DASC09_041660 [Saccharomycopsis crataegensis]